MTAKKRRENLEEVLQSTSDVLFPAELGEKLVQTDSTDTEGDTPLHVMVWRKNRYAVDLLIDSGADVNAIGDMGNTPLHVAVSQGDKFIIEALLKAGARSDIRSEFNMTALDKSKEGDKSIQTIFRKYDRT